VTYCHHKAGQLILKYMFRRTDGKVVTDSEVGLDGKVELDGEVDALPLECRA
jgi:hypothetical protein